MLVFAAARLLVAECVKEVYVHRIRKDSRLPNAVGFQKIICLDDHVAAVPQTR